MPGALACLRLVLQSICDSFSPSNALLDLSDWAFFGLLVKEFYGTLYQSGFFLLNERGSDFHCQRSFSSL